MVDPFAELDEPLPPLKVTCTGTDCERNLHCFLQEKRNAGLPAYGACRSCSADLIDWDRVRSRDPADMEFTFASLKRELIRHHMWTIRFDSESERKARMRGQEELYGSIRRRLISSIGKMPNGFDGRQTPMEGNVIYYAQHATATCCRKCLCYWHGVPMNRGLRADELDYCEILVKRYLDERLPDLQKEKRPELRKHRAKPAWPRV
jgi:Domain of unknown function (DUF4186)